MNTHTLRWLRMQRFLLSATPYMIAFLALGIIFLTTRLASTTQEVQATSAYTRVTNCVVAKNHNAEVTHQDVEDCYIQVEKNTGISLERFDEQVNNEQ